MRSSWARACTTGSRRRSALPIVGEVRGRGLMVCVDLVEPDGSGSRSTPRVATLDRKAWDRGAIVYARGTVLRLAPPLCITAEVDQLVDIVADTVNELARDLSSGRGR